MMIFTPAKINLGLRVLHKRGDGFHDLDSYIYAIPLYDILEIKPQSVDELLQTGIVSSTSMEDNLVFKALISVRKKYDIPPLKIHLHKQIPIQAGLGGGSGNAVGMLHLLNSVFKLGIDHDQMMHDAAQLGSDCPFFVKAEPSRVSSRGEQLESIDFSLKGFHIIIVKPTLSVSTAEAFAAIRPSTHLLPDIKRLSLDQYHTQLLNDFDMALSKKHPEIEEIKNSLLRKGAFMASLTGSGSAVFGLFKEKVQVTFPSSYFVWQGSLSHG